MVTRAPPPGASEITTRIIASNTIASDATVNVQRASLVSVEGISRQLVAMGDGTSGPDAAQDAIGAATTAAGDRLGTIALAMFATPDEDSPLDPYAKDVLATSAEQLQAILAEQNAGADTAESASTRSSRAVMGLSVIALAGVMAGLAAVIGRGRAGTALMALGWICAAGAVALLVVAAGLTGA